MKDILTITLNPALDVSTRVDAVRADEKLRCEAPTFDPGGGGVNVARAVGLITGPQGARAKAFVALAGHTGAAFQDLLEKEPLDPVIFTVPGATRRSLAVTDRETGQQYRFMLPGPDWDAALTISAIDKLLASVAQGAIVVLSGSQPPGVPLDLPSQLARALAPRQATVILDTSGAPLHALVEGDGAKPDVLRLDGAETADLAGRTLTGADEVSRFAATLVERGIARMVVLAMGPDGSVLATPEGRWHAISPDVPVRSRVGAGDSFVGSFALALARGDSPAEALNWGVAAASAAVMTDATELCRRADVLELAKTGTLTRL